MGEWGRDFRYSARLLLRTPGFTFVAVLSLALGIGVNTAVLSVGTAVLVQPLPVAHPEELAVAYWGSDGGRGFRQFNSSGARDEKTGRSLRSNYSYVMYEMLRRTAGSSANVFGFTFLRQVNVSVEGQPSMGAGMMVSGNYFAAMAAPVAIGRGLGEADDRGDAAPAVVLGYSFWQRAFGGDPAAVGRTVRVNGHPFTVVGVTARGYFGVSNGGFFPPADVTLPLHAQPIVSPRWTPDGGSLFTAEDVFWLRVMARVPAGGTTAAIESRLTPALTEHVASIGLPAFADVRNVAVVLKPGARGLDSLRSSLEQPIYMLAAVAGIVFLIACVNLASLVLSRGMARQQEFWIRLALGAGRTRLVRQTLAESVLLSVAGGVVGIALAIWGGHALVIALAGSTPTAISVDLDWRLVALSLAVSSAAALLCGMFPALRLSSGASADFIRQTGAGAGAPRLRAGRVLMLVQVAISVPLLVGAALFLRTIHNLSSVDLGFEPRGLVVFKMDPSLNGYEEPRVMRMYQQVLERVQTVAGVRSATLIENSLVSGWVSNTTVSVEGAPAKNMMINRVGPGFFAVVGVPLVSGRGIGLQDHGSAPMVAVVNETAVKQFFGGTNPIGRRVRVSGFQTSNDLEVVGVVRDSKYDSLKKAVPPTMFLPYFQSKGLTAMYVALRSDGVPGLGERLRAAVADVDRDVPITDLKTEDQQIDETIGRERAFTMLLVFFGLFALLLASIGLHGVTAYAVARRTSEIGIRLALGAQRTEVTWLILRQVVVLAAGGLVIGIPLAALLSRSTLALLYNVQPRDPISLTIGSGVLFLVAVVAGWIPARRAAKLDPLVALRRE